MDGLEGKFIQCLWNMLQLFPNSCDPPPNKKGPTNLSIVRLSYNSSKYGNYSSNCNLLCIHILCRIDRIYVKFLDDYPDKN